MSGGHDPERGCALIMIGAAVLLLILAAILAGPLGVGS